MNATRTSDEAAPAAVRYQRDIVDIVLAASCSPPAVRTLAVFYWASRDGSDNVEVQPVVSLRTTVSKRYAKACRRGTLPPDVEPTPSALKRAGYEFVLQAVDTVALIADDCGLVDASDPTLWSNAPAIVAAGWPPEREAEEIAKVVARLKAKAAEEARRAKPSGAVGSAGSGQASNVDYNQIGPY